MAAGFLSSLLNVKCNIALNVCMLFLLSPALKKGGLWNALRPSFRPSFLPSVLPSVRHTFVSSIHATPLDQSTPNLASIFFGTSRSHFLRLEHNPDPDLDPDPQITLCFRHTFVSSIGDTPLLQSTPNLASIFFGTSKSHFFYLGTQSRSRSGFRSTSYTKIGQMALHGMAFHSKFGHIMVTYTSYIYIYPGSTTT